MTLSSSQKTALKHVTDYARSRKEHAQTVIVHVLRMSNIAPNAFEDVVDQIKSRAQVALHFHPDRLCSNMKSVAENLLNDGVYKSQFETQISNGSVTAFQDGDRDKWEAQLFGRAYQNPDSSVTERPKYGALNLLSYPDGPSPRFGSCYFLLDSNVAKRCTFTYLDSHLAPEERGTYEEFDDIMAALLSEAFSREFALGEHALPPKKLLKRILEGFESQFANLYRKTPSRNLNHYIEAQVHGDIGLLTDVNALVIDPSFRGTFTGTQLQQLCERYNIMMYWHSGFVLPANEVPDDFRGPTMPSLAKRVAQEGIVHASAIGESAMSLQKDSAPWANRGSYQDVLQELKLLWHCVVRYGHTFHNPPHRTHTTSIRSPNS